MTALCVLSFMAAIHIGDAPVLTSRHRAAIVALVALAAFDAACVIKILPAWGG